MRALLDVILIVLQLYWYVIIIVAIMSWLIAFNVINIYNDLVRSIWGGLNAVTEPLLRPIRNLLPNLGGIDISPVILLLVIYLIQRVIELYIYPYVLLSGQDLSGQDASALPWNLRAADALVLRLRLSPKSAADRIDGIAHLSDGSCVLKIRVRAVPQDGEANRALIQLLAKALDIGTSAVHLEGGATARGENPCHLRRRGGAGCEARSALRGFLDRHAPRWRRKSQISRGASTSLLRMPKCAAAFSIHNSDTHADRSGARQEVAATFDAQKFDRDLAAVDLVEIGAGILFLPVGKSCR